MSSINGGAKPPASQYRDIICSSRLSQLHVLLLSYSPTAPIRLQHTSEGACCSRERWGIIWTLSNRVMLLERWSTEGAVSSLIAYIMCLSLIRLRCGTWGWPVWDWLWTYLSSIISNCMCQSSQVRPYGLILFVSAPLVMSTCGLFERYRPILQTKGI